MARQMKPLMLFMVAIAVKSVLADVISVPQPIAVGIVLLIFVGLPVGIIALIAYLVIRKIRKEHKQAQAEKPKMEKPHADK
jgi:hypothetical protein